MRFFHSGASELALVTINSTSACLLPGYSSNQTGRAFKESLTVSGPAGADDATAASFNRNCIGCHVGGGNVVQAGKTLQKGDLDRSRAGSVEAIYELVYGGKGKMPGYGSGCTPKGKCTFGPRLSDEEIQRLSIYVLEQAAKGWK